MARTARDLIKRSLRIINVVAAGEDPDANDAFDALEAANDMLDSWSTERLYAFVINEVTHPLTAGTADYNIGTGATINTARPLKVQFAFSRDANGYDRPMAILDQDDYASVRYKSLGQTYPEALFYQTTFPTGVINLWPVPPSALTLHMGLWQPLTEIASLDTEVNFPPGYREAFVYSLAERLAPEYGRPIGNDVIAIAANARGRIKSVNLPESRAVCELQGIGSPYAYEPFSDSDYI